MDKVSLLNVNNEKVDVAVVRFFSLNNNNYFIYSMNEVDEQSYIKLYAVKITSDINGIISSNITDENEWLSVKEMIKTIIKGNKDGNLSVVDLDYRKLENVKLSESRVFKLSVQLVDLLQANKKSFAAAPEAPVINNVTANSFANQMPSVEPVAPTVTPVVNPIPVPTIDPTPVVNTIPSVEPVMPQPVVNPTPTVDYQAMYLAEKEKSLKLSQEIESLKSKIDAIKNML
jgi:hypothetical protein